MEQAARIAGFIRQQFRHFNAAALADAADAYVKLLDDGGKMFLAMAGAMSTAELGISLAEMIRENKIHAICCTGANLEEDVFNLVGHNQYARIPDYRDLTPSDESKIQKGKEYRVTDTILPEEAMRKVEKAVSSLWLKAQTNKKRHFPHEFLFEALLNGSLKKEYQIDPQDSWVLAAAEKNLPVFVPGWEDSTLGNVFAANVIEGEIKDPNLIKGGIEYMVELADWYEKTAGNKPSIGFFQIGGGIAGDFPICLHGDTGISLVNGTEQKIKDLPVGERSWVYGVKPNGEIVPVQATSLGKTKTDSSHIAVTLDNGEVIRCTKDHRFMLRDGGYKQAQDLSVGESLMPLYRKVNDDGYELFRNNKTGKWRKTHSAFCRMVNKGQIKEAWERIRLNNGPDKFLVVHHRDFNKRNNNPNNLLYMGENEHWKYHAAIGSNRFNGLWERPGYREKMQELSRVRMQKLWKDKEFTSRLSQRSKTVMNRLWSDPTFIKKMSVLKSNGFNDHHPNLRNDVTIEAIKALVRRGVVKAKDVAGELGCSRHRIVCVVHDTGVNGWIDYVKTFYPEYVYRNKYASDEERKLAKLRAKKKYRNAAKGKISEAEYRPKSCAFNHKVVSVEYVFEESDFYDLSVLETENFALSAGVFVHNCVVPMFHADLHKKDVPLWAYFAQISDSTTSYGSYSGAVPNEKITWDKLGADTPRFVIESDASIVAPLIFAYVLGTKHPEKKTERVKLAQPSQDRRLSVVLNLGKEKVYSNQRLSAVLGKRKQY